MLSGLVSLTARRTKWAYRAIGFVEQLGQNSTPSELKKVLEPWPAEHNMVGEDDFRFMPLVPGLLAAMVVDRGRCRVARPCGGSGRLQRPQDARAAVRLRLLGLSPFASRLGARPRRPQPRGVSARALHNQGSICRGACELSRSCA